MTTPRPVPLSMPGRARTRLDLAQMVRQAYEQIDREAQLAGDLTPHERRTAEDQCRSLLTLALALEGRLT